MSGLICPVCKENNGSTVIDTRFHGGFNHTRRRRACKVCGCRFSTIERVASENEVQDLKVAGSKNPGTRPNEMQAKLITLYRSGLTIGESAERCGIEYQDAREYLTGRHDWYKLKKVSIRHRKIKYQLSRRMKNG